MIRDMVEMRLNRKRAYRRLFPVERGMVVGDARAILADLKKFARLPDAPIVRDGHGRVDPIASALLTGRQEVVNRILAMIHMDDRVMLNLHEDQDR